MSKGHRVWLFSLSAILLTVSAEAAFEIDFMRHGETLWNRAKVLQGTLSYPQLSAKGVAMTEATAAGLAAAGVRYDRVFTSPLCRTRETAGIVAAKTGPKPVVHALLRERCFGTAEGKRIPDGKTVKDLLAGASGVETEAEVAARVRAFLDEMKALDGKVERVLAVTHSHLLKGLILALRGEAFDNGTLLPNNCINTVRYEDGRFTLVSTGRIYYDAAAFDAIKQPRIIAHRGAGDLTMPEHSRAAYRDAVAKRCDIVKLDLHETKDGIIVLSHDDTLTREMGWKVDIKAVTYAEIMEKGVYREKGGVRGEKIVRLDEALEIVRSVPEFWIDFKYYTPEFAERAIAEFAKAEIDLSRVMCATFTCVALTYLRTAHPEIRRIAHMGNRTDLGNFLEMKDYYDLWGINIGARTRIARPEGLVTEQPLETIAELKRRGLWVSLHSIGYAHEHAKYRASGCDAYVSDDVSVLRPTPFGSLAGGTYYVDNRTGDDANDGRSREHALRTLARAARMLGPGDVLEIAPGEPYRESLVIDSDGTAERPVVIHGNGAVITGLEPIPNDSWKPVGDGVWFSANDACWGSLKPRLVDGAGREVEFKWDKAGVTCRTSDGQRPKDLYGYFRESGVKIEDHSNIVVENITAERFANDGFNIHGTCSNIVFRNIEARWNGDDGFSVHERSQTSVRGGRFHCNGDGIADVHISQTSYEDVVVESNETFGVGFQGGVRAMRNMVVRDNGGVPIEIKQNRVRLKGLDPSDPLNRATVRLENVKASGGTGDPIRVEKGCEVKAVNCNFMKSKKGKTQ